MYRSLTPRAVAAVVSVGALLSSAQFPSRNYSEVGLRQQSSATPCGTSALRPPHSAMCIPSRGYLTYTRTACGGGVSRKSSTPSSTSGSHRVSRTPSRRNTKKRAAAAPTPTSHTKPSSSSHSTTPVPPIAENGEAHLLDEAGAADVLTDQHTNPRCNDEDEHPDLAPTTSPVIGEAEEVELAAEVQEVTDFTAEVGNVGDGDDAGAMAATAGDGGTSAGALGGGAQAATGTNAPAIGSLLDFESPLNLRLATLTRQHGKAFRAIAVFFPMERGSLDFLVTFEDIASGARLVCRLDEVKVRYFDWVAQFRACFIALFMPTLQHANAALLQNAILAARPARPPPPPGSYHPRLNDEPDHLIFSYAKLRETVSLVKRDTNLVVKLLTVAVLNAYPQEWQRFISAPMSCVPQSFMLAAFGFSGKDNNIMLNKELLHAQLAISADTIVANAAASAGVSSTAARGRGASLGSTGAGGTLSAAPKSGDGWLLIFVSAPVKTMAGTSAVPPMQDLLTGQFVEPLTLSDKSVVYIVGTGAAAQSFAQFPLARKGKRAFTILLQDIESQLDLQRPHRTTLTTMLAQALDSFSRVTWMGLMSKETSQLHVPHPPNAFYRLQKRTVTREIVPSFLEPVFSPSSRAMARMMGGGVGGMRAMGGTAGRGGGGGGGPGAGGGPVGKSSRQLEEHIRTIFNNPERLEDEQSVRDKMKECKVFLVNITTAGVTAARRADNPFSSKNGITDVVAQLWHTPTQMNPPSIIHHTAKVSAAEGVEQFVSPDKVIPPGLPIGPRDAKNPKDRAENAVLVAWDAKRVLLFLRDSPRLQEFLFNGGKIWCAQYAQYLLKGFNHLNLATIERTLVQYHDGPVQSQMHPLAKLKLVYETQLEVAVNSRQLKSIQHRMNGLLASAEMETQGLQLLPQADVSRFANTLRLDHERLEKVLQEKIMDFTRQMDDDVRQRINFRSPQDISTIIYGGALCRHLGSRFVPVRPTKYPITCLFPQAVCRVSGTAVPDVYTQPEALLGSFQQSSLATNFNSNDVAAALKTVDILTRRASTDQLMNTTAVVVVIVKVKMGGLLEQVSIYCPGASGGEPELNTRVAIDDILPVSESPDVVTVAMLKKTIASYKPLHSLRPLKRHGKKSYDLRNVLIVTNSVHEKLGCLVDTGVVSTIVETVLGPSTSSAASEKAPFERVCFVDMSRGFPPPPQGADSFESDFSELSSVGSSTFSARSNWESHTKEFMSLGGMEGVMRAMISHCASVIGTPRDPFRNTYPVPSALPQGLHGQEQASTPGMLWMVTPPSLHPILQRFLRGRGASSGADAMERVTVFLSPYKSIDLSFFSALQQLRFTEKKMQLFEEGCLFRAVLPECRDRVHGELCHCVTATGRLSSQSPNLQNIPKEEDLRRLIVSRFGAEGRMIEADYSQLEVVVLAALSRDPRMMQEIREKVDFHCLRVSLMTKEPYEEVVKKAKVEKDPHYMQLRQQAKVFSFQRQYGAGVSTIATTTGLTEEEVDRLIAAEEQHYRELGKYYRLVMDCVEAGADRLLRLRTLDTALWTANMRRIVMLTEPMHYFVVPTGSKFNFSKDRKSVPRLKNYPVQGLAGEIVQVMCGQIVREFFSRRNYDGKAFLVNTVHDCVWVDAHESVADNVREDLARIMDGTQKVIDELWPDMHIDVPFSAEVHIGPSLGELSK